MAILKNASGKLFTIGGKLVTVGTTSDTGLDIYTLQTLQLPFGDQISIQATSEYLWLTSDLELAFIWENMYNGMYCHWGSSIDSNYLYEADGGYLHIYELNMYEYQNDSAWQDVVGEGVLEAAFIADHGRYLGTITIDSAGHWRVENWRA